MLPIILTKSEVFQEIPGDPNNCLMTIPKDICEHLNLKPGDMLDIKIENKTIIVKKHG